MELEALRLVAGGRNQDCRRGSWGDQEPQGRLTEDPPICLADHGRACAFLVVDGVLVFWDVEGVPVPPRDLRFGAVMEQTPAGLKRASSTGGAPSAATASSAVERDRRPLDLGRFGSTSTASRSAFMIALCFCSFFMASAIEVGLTWPEQMRRGSTVAQR